VLLNVLVETATFFCLDSVDEQKVQKKNLKVLCVCVCNILRSGFTDSASIKPGLGLSSIRTFNLLL